ncbi:MAG: ThiF family adenylyltransferase [Planctomycetota bacterium]
MTDLARYQRQIIYPPLGEAGQERLGRARAVVFGCGALGSSIANWLVRAGVGHLRLIDRDFVEITNLHRQTLFDEADAEAALPKAVAAAEKLRRINRHVEIEPIVADLSADNVESLLAGADVAVDGTDNFETRFLVNDAALKLNLPWVYGGCVGMEGQSMTILPGETPCLMCLLPECPPVGSTATCDTAGVLGPIVGVISAIESGEALKILAGRREAVSRHLVSIGLWDMRLRQIDVGHLRGESGCAACGRGEYRWLSGREGAKAAVLCGRNSVQLTSEQGDLNLDELAERLRLAGQVKQNAFLVRLKAGEHELTVFADGRSIVSGTNDVATARTLYARYIGC